MRAKQPATIITGTIASPSSPSVRFTAFDAPTITKTANGMKSQPSWIRDAKSKVVLKGTGDWLMSMLPDDPETTILKRLKRPKGDEQEPQDAGERSEVAPSLRTTIR